MIEININDPVLVKLTPYALQVMRENHRKLFGESRFAPIFKPPEPDADGWTRMQMWSLMQEFGRCMYLGNPQQCFEGGVLRFPAGRFE